VDGDLWKSSGGFLGFLGIMEEETECALRWLDQGHKIIYDPSLSVEHHMAMNPESYHKRMAMVQRNALLIAICRYPVSLLPYALCKYAFQVVKSLFRRRSQLGVMTRGLPLLVVQAVRIRKPVSWRTIQEWRAKR
jgi:hypothetical protein